MDEPLDELYLKWLYGHIGNPAHVNPSRTHWELARQLLKKEFVWFVPNDDNRCQDGKDLRFEFVEECKIAADDNWLDLGCSMLEMLLGLSRRLSFYAEGDPAEWFWHMLENLGLGSINDRAPFDPQLVDETLDRVIWRVYEPDGSGGLFPLRRPDRDQREVELWYQLNAYLLERT